MPAAFSCIMFGFWRPFFTFCSILWSVPLVAYLGGGGIFGVCSLPLAAVAFTLGGGRLSSWAVVGSTYVGYWLSRWTGQGWLLPLLLACGMYANYKFAHFIHKPGKHLSFPEIRWPSVGILLFRFQSLLTRACLQVPGRSALPMCPRHG